MLEFFVIFSKSGIVLFATVNQSLNQIINGLVKHVFLEERTGQYQTDQLLLKYLLDNELDLVFVVGYQKFLQLSYVDKFLTDIQLAFRDKFSSFDMKKLLNDSNYFTQITARAQKQANSIYKKCDLAMDQANILDFGLEFASIYQGCVKLCNAQPRQESMRTFQDSAKSKKTVASLAPQHNKEPHQQPMAPPPVPELAPVALVAMKKPKPFSSDHAIKKSKTSNNKKAQSEMKKGKAARQWDLSGADPDEFDFSKDCSEPSQASTATSQCINNSVSKNIEFALSPKDIETNLVMTDTESSDEDDEEEDINDVVSIENLANKSGGSYLSSIWKTISYNKTLDAEHLRPVLDQLRDHLTAKNVAAEVAEKLCISVSRKLEGQTVSTWTNLKKLAREALQEAVLNILNPRRCINILREIQAKQRPPYVIVFCGVNGVGKSTNLAKIANWLLNNKVEVLVVACDTFRAGAIEQLKTHVMALKSIHKRGKSAPVRIELFERGYGRDSAAIAMEAINYARAHDFNCVMVDTAGRMQDNEPLMRQLAKLIKINNPDMTLFVGEALVGNEAVDQLTRFNKSLMDCGCRVEDSTHSAIDGIVLTKFDTIDDQVGAAISMTYVTGQPIVFVGVGQTYRDLKQLDAKAVTRALMR